MNEGHLHESDLSNDPDLLKCLLDDARAEIARLRGKVGGVLRVAGDGELPTRAHSDDVGLDLYTWGHDWVIDPGEFRDVDCGIRVEFPEGVWGMIVGRSSTLRKKKLLVMTGIIDTGYTGPLFAGVQNMSPYPTKIEEGERVAQLVLFPNVTERISVVRVEKLGKNGGRGERGFGSSG